MKHYLKIENNQVVEAPQKLVKDGKVILGYNSDSNKKMLIADGYKQFNKGYYAYDVKDGVIVEKTFVDPQQTIFTKLEIRRACRALGIQEKLNFLLDSADQIKSDWLDAQQIDLSDQMFVKAVELGVFTAEEIQNVKDYLK